MVCAEDERVIGSREELKGFGFCGYDEEVVEMEGCEEVFAFCVEGLGGFEVDDGKFVRERVVHFGRCWDGIGFQDAR